MLAALCIIVKPSSVDHKLLYNTYIHVYTYIYIHTYIHVYTYIHSGKISTVAKELSVQDVMFYIGLYTLPIHCATM